MSERHQLLVMLAGLVVGGLAMTAAGDYWIGIGVSLAMWIALTQSWAVLCGLSGYVSLGHVVFYGLGAYVVVATWQAIPLTIALFLAAGVAALFAAIVGLPVLRVRGPYFVILTFGLAELVKYCVLAFEASQGNASRILLGAPDIEMLFACMLVLAGLACVLAYAVRVHRIGHALRAIRENEEAAATIGIPLARYKLIAFVLSAAIPGAVGGVMAVRSTYFEPLLAFDPMISFSMIAMAILGGSDDLRGPVIGALALAVLSELLWVNAPQFYMIVLGVCLTAFVLWRPQGLLGPRRQAKGAADGAP